MPNIVVLSTVHHYQDARIFSKQIPSIKKKYINLSYIVPSGNSKPFVENDIQIIPLPVPNSKYERFISLQISAWKIINKIRPDIIHFHDPELMILALILKIKIKSKIIFDVHENISGTLRYSFWLPRILRKILPAMYRLFERLIINYFDKIIIAESSYKKTYGEDAVEILNYPLIRSDDKEFSKDWIGRTNLAYAGDITELRGIFKIINILKILNEKKIDFHFHLIGRFAPADLEAKVKHQLKVSELKDKVTIYGRLSLHETYEILRTAQIGLSLLRPVPNYISSLPTKIFDYMYNKAVVIANDFELYKKYIDKFNTGITVDYEKTEVITNKIIELIHNPEEMDKIAYNGKMMVTNKWNWRTEERKLLEVYQELVNKCGF